MGATFTRWKNSLGIPTTGECLDRPGPRLTSTLRPSTPRFTESPNPSHPKHVFEPLLSRMCTASLVQVSSSGRGNGVYPSATRITSPGRFCQPKHPADDQHVTSYGDNDKYYSTIDYATILCTTCSRSSAARVSTASSSLSRDKWGGPIRTSSPTYVPGLVVHTKRR